jgi:hypothetical protein
MITKITTVEEFKQIFIESLLNNTNKVTKISEGSVLNGIAYGVAKLSQKIVKDVAVVESHLFPDSAVGQYLDTIADLRGVAPRFGSLPSKTFVRLVGTPGTTYQAGVNNFIGQGVQFSIDEDTVIPSIGYTYVKVTSISNGSSTNVDPLTINRVSPIPVGHDYCINEYSATGGRDFEDDELFRIRIKEEVNILARGTISYIEQVLRKYNSNVLRVYNYGLDSNGDLNIGIGSVNGSSFSNSQLEDLLLKSEQWLSLCELKPDGRKNYGIKFKNVEYYPIDISCRVEIDSSFSADEIRKEIQISLSKLVDHRFWKDGSLIDWIDLINSVRGVNGVNRVLDNHFYPNNSFYIPKGKLPIFRGFLMLNTQGVLIENISGTLNPFFYPSDVDFSFQASVLKSL